MVGFTVQYSGLTLSRSHQDMWGKGNLEPRGSIIPVRFWITKFKYTAPHVCVNCNSCTQLTLCSYTGTAVLSHILANAMLIRLDETHTVQ